MEMVRAKEPILKQLTLGGYLIAALFALLGVWLVYLGSTGMTEFSFFGQQFKSANVGIAAIFLAAVVVVLMMRSVVRAMDYEEVPISCRDGTSQGSGAHMGERRRRVRPPVAETAKPPPSGLNRRERRRRMFTSR